MEDALFRPHRGTLLMENSSSVKTPCLPPLHGQAFTVDSHVGERSDPRQRRGRGVGNRGRQLLSQHIVHVPQCRAALDGCPSGGRVT